MDHEARDDARRDRRSLVLASFAMLFAELALIRWVAAYQIYVAYFTNFVLLASFLGIGVGFLRARAPRDLSVFAPLALGAVAAMVFVFRVVKVLGPGRDIETVLGLPAPPIWVVLPVIFLGVAFAMALVAEGVARLFARFEPLEAYRLDIAGSLLGILAFSALSFLQAGPVVWGLVLASLFWALSPEPMRPGAHPRRTVGAVAVLGVFALGSLLSSDSWSPYYRVTVHAADATGRIPIRVNSLPHQSILPVSTLRQQFYARPYEHLADGRPGNTLIVGAGSGNDVALALSQGAESVDAVEIDPVIQRTGRERHPARPYADPRVRAIVDDGRAFLERTHRRYDLILFALPDSLTLVSGQGSLRLESYLFTEEAMRTVRDRLAPGGAFAMYNYYRPFVFERYASTIASVFGHPPCFDAGVRGAGPRRQAVLTVGLQPDDVGCSTPWVRSASAPAPATDDRPFPYVEGRAIPSLYLGWLAAIVVASVLIVRAASTAPLASMRPYLDLVLMGAAFLLLETMNVVRFALLFGTTWFVNALVFAGILLAVLGAVEVARRVRLPKPAVMYAALLACLVLAWAVPPEPLLQLPVVPRFVVAVVLAFAPVFLANLIFAQRFRDVGSSTVAFGANLLGAMTGGVLEYAAIAIGYRNLLVAVALLYGAAFVVGRAHLRRTAALA